MSDDFEDLLKRWLRDRAGSDRSALQALAGNVAVLPPRRPSRRTPLAVAASILIIIGVIALGAPRPGHVGSEADGSQATSPSPLPTPSAATASAASPSAGLPDPAAFVGNPWFESCGGLSYALTAFEVPRARDLPLFLPAMLKAPEIERDEPAFVLVFKGAYPGVTSRRVWSDPSADPTLAPNHYDMCVIVGPISGAGSRGIYGGVSFDGFDPNPPGAASAPPPTTEAPPFPVWPGLAWTDAAGAPGDPLVLATFAGPQTCEWNKAAFLEIGWPFGTQALEIDKMRRYVRDPEGIFKEGFVILDRLDLNATLPADAAYAGYRSGEIELWTSPTTIDNAVYLRWPDHVERWPRMENVSMCG